jgi:hypothetical protein
VDLFSGVKRPGREDDHSPPPSNEVKNARNSTPPYIFMAWCLVKRSEVFTSFCTVINIMGNLSFVSLLSFGVKKGTT